MQLSEDTLIIVLSSIFTRMNDKADAWPSSFPIGDLKMENLNALFKFLLFK